MDEIELAKVMLCSTTNKFLTDGCTLQKNLNMQRARHCVLRYSPLSHCWSVWLREFSKITKCVKMNISTIEHLLANRLRANFHSHAQSLLSLLAGGDLAWGKCGWFWQIITAGLSLTKTGWIMPSLPPDLLQNDMPVSKNFLIFDHMASSDANLVEQRTVNL